MQSLLKQHVELEESVQTVIVEQQQNAQQVQSPSLTIELREWLDGKNFQAATRLMENVLDPFVKENMQKHFPPDKDGNFRIFEENFLKAQEKRIAERNAKQDQVRDADSVVRVMLQDKRKAYASVAQLLCVLCGNTMPTIQDIKHVIKHCNEDGNLLPPDNLHYPTEPLGIKDGYKIMGDLYKCHLQWGSANGNSKSEKHRLEHLNDQIAQAQRNAREKGPQPMWICACRKAFLSKSSIRDSVTMDAKFDLYTLVAIMLHHLKKVFTPSKHTNIFEARRFLRKLLFTSEAHARRAHGLEMMTLSENDIRGALGAMDATLQHCLEIASAKHHKVIMRA